MNMLQAQKPYQRQDVNMMKYTLEHLSIAAELCFKPSITLTNPLTL